MGVGLASRRPVLPAPTDSVLTSADDTGLNTDVATDLSIKTNATSQTLPADGTPITIKTGNQHSAMTKLLNKQGQQSQTSLLIEYFEGGVGHDPSERRPSVRVKVTPSKSSKNRVRSEGQVIVTETRGTRRPSVSRRIALGTDSNSRVEELGSISSLEELREAQRLGAPIEIEVRAKDGSDVSGLSESPEARYIVPGSDISSMPADSMLGVQRPGVVTVSSRSENVSKDGRFTNAALGGAAAAAALAADRNAHSHRLSPKVIEKISNRPRNTSGTKAIFTDQSRSESSVSREPALLTTRDRRRRAGKLPEEGSMTSGTVSSMISSLHPHERVSVDQRSTVSGTSNISVNNPKLLQAVEDAIKRLLPELQELRKDQTSTNRQFKTQKDRTPSDVSGSSFSREDVVHQTSGGRARRRSSRGSDEVVTSATRRRERQRKLGGYDSPSERSFHHSESAESMSIDDGVATKGQGRNRRLRDAGTGGLAGTALTAAALRSHESFSSVDEQERHNGRSRSRSSRSTSVAESEEIFHKHAIPPMPLRSEIDSELTRSSLLSSNTNGTATPTHREVREVVRGSPREMSSATSPTPTDYRPPMDIRKGLGTYHGNFSERDLPVHHEELSESEEEQYDDFDDSRMADRPFEMQAHREDELLDESERLKRYERNLHQQHPIRRGLSPIQSVASYTTTDPNRNSMHQPRSVDSLSSLKKRHNLKDQISISSLSSAPSTDLARSHRPHGINLETRSQILSQHDQHRESISQATARDQFFEEQHSQNDHYREPYSSPGPRIALQNVPNSPYDDHHDRVTAGRQVEQHSVSNPEYYHPLEVESAVASLYDSSVVDAAMSQSPRYSQHSYDQSYHSSPRLPQGDEEVVMTKTGSPLKQQLSQHSHEEFVNTSTQEFVSPPHSTSRLVETRTQEFVSPPNSTTRFINTSAHDVASPNHSSSRLVNAGSHNMASPVHSAGRLVNTGGRDLVSPPHSIGRANVAGSREVTTPPHTMDRSMNTNTREVVSSPHGFSKHGFVGPTGYYSPSHSVDESINEIQNHDLIHDQPEINTNVPLTHAENVSPESEITTNPSVIHGPIGGHQSSQDQWAYEESPPRAKAGLPFTAGTVTGAGLAGADLVPEALSINRDQGYDPGRELYTNKQIMSTPLAAKDEGYETGVNHSPNSYPRERKIQGTNFNAPRPDDDGLGLDDPFVSKTRDKYTSGLSDGMAMPLYDNATGRAIDRIHSKDIVALMDHLTVRDAQRNARDTEILVTLVRTAAEMRNSFEDMKKFIAEQDDLIMDTADIQHDKTQKVIVDNRPTPSSSARATRILPSPEDDTPAKRKNAFKRMLDGLGSKNSKELQNIEAMLMQLLDEVETLRDLQTGVIQPHELINTSQESTERSRMSINAAHDPQGGAVTTPGVDRLETASSNSSRQGDHRTHDGQVYSNRVNTDYQGGEEYADNNGVTGRSPVRSGNLQQTPLAPIQDGARYAREVSEPHYIQGGNRTNGGVQSNEHTPHLSQGEASSNRKHKSFVPSFLPKMVSRWSKTTASSGGDQHRSSVQTKPRPSSQLSQSDSELGEYPYDPQGDDRLRSNTSLQDQHYGNQENRPPSPLLPSTVSDNPKYQAHRNSLNLQHPQPRQGPTGRYQSHLESEAQNYPQGYHSPTAGRWGDGYGQQQNQHVDNNSNNYQHGRQLSPISDGGYSDNQSNRSVSTVSEGSTGRGSRFPAGSEPLMPQRATKVVISPPGSRQPTYIDHVAAARAGSPAFDKSPVNALRSSPGQQRKPSGPRPLAASGSLGKNAGGEYGAVKRTRFRNSPNQVDSDDEITTRS